MVLTGVVDRQEKINKVIAYVRSVEAWWPIAPSPGRIKLRCAPSKSFGNRPRPQTGILTCLRHGHLCGAG